MTVVQENEKLLADLAGAKTALDEAGKQAADAVGVIAGKDKVIGERDARIAELTASLDDATATIKKATATFDEMQGKISALEAELKSAKDALANPAMAQAVAPGTKEAVAEGGAVSGKMTRAEAEAELKKITDPRERARFRLQHEKELIAG